MTEIKTAFEMEKSNKAKLQQDMDKLRTFYDNKVKNLDSRLIDLPTTAQGEYPVMKCEMHVLKMIFCHI